MAAVPIEFPRTISEQERMANKLITCELRRCSRLTKKVDCCLCSRAILPGLMYRDGGWRSRAHDHCVKRYATPIPDEL